MKQKDKLLRIMAAFPGLLGCVLMLVPCIMQIAALDADDRAYTKLAVESKTAHIADGTATPLHITEVPIQNAARQTFSKEEFVETMITIPVAAKVPAEANASEPPAVLQCTPLPTASVMSIEDMTTGKPPALQPVNAAALQKQNSDYIAWLNIPDTPVDYPVVQSDDADYYLHHLFSGEKSKLGCLFSLSSADYAAPSRNIAIYGHHLSNSTAMFSSLVRYKRRDYLQAHPTILLDTLYGKRTYRIFAVLNIHVSDWDASTASFLDDEAFLTFVRRAQAATLMETGITVHADDSILTLITCDRTYGGVDGRLLVMAVQQ